MAKGSPSLLALLGLAAVAGYQNRDKLREMLNGPAARTRGDFDGGPVVQREPQGGMSSGAGWLDQIIGGLGSGTAGAGMQGSLAGGLRDLVDRFRSAGQADPVDSWVSSGPNRPVPREDLRAALGQDLIGDLAQRSGLSEAELIARLERTLPELVDEMTPEGRLPDHNAADPVRGY